MASGKDRQEYSDLCTITVPYAYVTELDFIIQLPYYLLFNYHLVLVSEPMVILFLLLHLL